MKPAHALVILLAVGVFLTLPLLATRVKSGVPPAAPVASFTYSPDIPGPGETIIFNASSSYDSDGCIVKYTWDFGEGNVTTVTTPVITHQYAVDGNYTVELTVTDNSGLTGVACAVVQVRTVVFFRVCVGSTLIPLANVQVTVYYYNGMSWVMAPVGPSNLQIKYDNKTQPNLAKTDAQRNRNPGYTASILRQNASNIGFDVHPSCWTVYFKFQYGPFVTYWPDTTTTVYSYKKGLIETHNYLPGHRAYWDASISKYVIKAGDIPGHGVDPSEDHPIIVYLPLAPPPTQQYYLTIRTAPNGITTIPGQGFYLKGTNVSLTAPAYVNTSSVTRYRFSYWDVDGTSQGIGVNPITVIMNANHTVTAHYVFQYYVTFSQLGVGSDFTGSVMKVGGVNYTRSGHSDWYDNQSVVSFSYYSPLVVTANAKRYGWASTSGLSSSQSGSLTVSASGTVTGNYKTQYYLTVSSLRDSPTPVSGWFDSGTPINASVTSPYPGAAGTRYVCTGWTGTGSVPPSGIGSSVAFNITSPSSITWNWKTQYYLTVSSVHGTTSGQGWYDSGTTANASVTPLTVSGAPGTQYVFTSWSGNATGTTSPSEPITMNGTKTAIANYKTQYYLTLTTSPPGVNSPSGAGWYDAGTNGTISTPGFFDIVPSSSRYRFNGWTTTYLTEITDPTRSPTTVKMDQAKTVTANYVVQDYVIFSQSGVGVDFTGTVVVIDGVNYKVADLPKSFWWDASSVHTFVYQSPLVVTPNVKQYVLASTSGLSTSQSGSITVSGSVSVTGNYKTGNYKTQYCLTVKTDPASITTISGEGWYDVSSNATLNAPAVAGYQFNYWDVDGVSQGNGVYLIMVTMNGSHTATAHYTITPPTPVGGYSISLAKQTPLSQIATYIMLAALSSVVLILKKRKRK